MKFYHKIPSKITVEKRRLVPLTKKYFIFLVLTRR